LIGCSIKRKAYGEALHALCSGVYGDGSRVPISLVWHDYYGELNDK